MLLLLLLLLLMWLPNHGLDVAVLLCDLPKQPPCTEPSPGLYRI